MAAVEFADSDSSVASPRAFEQSEFYVGYVRTVGSVGAILVLSIMIIQGQMQVLTMTLWKDMSVGYSRGDGG